MSLTNIEYGSLASSEVMNNNFEYLDNRITSVAGDLTSASSSIYSNIASLSTTLSGQSEEIASDLQDLKTYTEDFKDEFDSINNAPNYSQGIGINLPYSALADGYVYAGVDGMDTAQYVYVNNLPVHGHCGYSGGKWVYSGSLIRVSTGDVISSSRPSGNYYFYPMKGV